MNEEFKESLARVMRAREIVCPSIIICFHNNQQTFANATLIIDYIEDYYQKKSQVIGDFIFYGNSTDKVKGYGDALVFDRASPEFYIEYFFDVSSYLYDPEREAPFNSRSSTFEEINLDNREDIKNILVEFQDYLERMEKDSQQMDPDSDGIFVPGEFTTPSEVNSILNNNERLKSFNQIINESNYFSKKLFK